MGGMRQRKEQPAVARSDTLAEKKDDNKPELKKKVADLRSLTF